MTRRRGAGGATGLPAVALVALFLAAGCGPRGAARDAAAPGERAATASDTLRFERSRGAPGDTVQGHAVYAVTWPDPAAVLGQGPLVDSLRAAIRRAVAEGQAGADGQPLPADSLAARFLDGHAATMADFPGGPREWWIRRRISLETIAFGLATLRIDDERYEGGAHGLATTFYESFDPATGARLRLADVADPAGLDSLRALGERAFRRARELAADADLKEAGWFAWQGGRFDLNDNFGVTRAGLVFHWNPYDIAAYAWGPSTITLPWDEVRPFLRADGPLAMGR